MTDNNNMQNNMIECPRCHIVLNRKEINLHNIKCRIINNQLKKNNDINNININNININKNDITEKEIKKDEYKNFMDNFPSMIIDDKNIKLLIKNFILIINNKITLLENNIQEINEQIKKLNENNLYYFKAINNSIDNLNKKNFIKKEINKEKKKEYNIHKFNNKALLYRNETDININEKKNLKKKLEIIKSTSPFLIEEKKLLNTEEETNNYLYSKKSKNKVNSEKNIINNNKDIITDLNEDINKKYKEIIKREKKINNKYKGKKYQIKNNIYNYNDTINILTNDNIINHSLSSNNIQIDMRRSLSFGDLNNITKKDNKKKYNINLEKINENEDINDDNDNNENIDNNDNIDNIDNNDNNDNNEILLDSLDIILDKIANLEMTLVNIESK